MGSCKYYMEVTLGWMLNNKIIVLLSLLSFCLFVSTLALAGQKNRLYWELYDCNNKNITTTTSAPTSASSEGTPTTDPKPVGKSLDGVVNQEDSEDSSGKLFKILSGTA